MTFCTDTDLLHWEPNLLREASFASQTLLTGTGDLAGTTFTIDAGSLASSHVTPTQVIVLTGGTSGCYPIVSVDSATQLTISTLYDNLFPVGGSGVASPVGSAVDLAFAIRTFWPQRRVVSDLLLAAAGLDPTRADIDEVVFNPESLRKPAALGTLHMIYSALAAAAAEPAALATRADMYERIYRRALRNSVVQLDLNGDGEADVVRPLNVLQLQRV
ncbi:MAG: hypothetical protein WBD40_16470 [Tepidisphaeraceae bacterium]